MTVFAMIASKIYPPTHPVVVAAAAGEPVDQSHLADAPHVDADALLAALAIKKNCTELHWRTSIVDLLKLAGVDSSLTTRKALAAEMGYSGDLSDTEKMNTWLHQSVMAALANNGKLVPAMQTG